MRTVFALLICILPGGLWADTCTDLSQTKTATYGFRPSQLDKAQQAAKSLKMDSFWNQVKAAGPAGLDCVRGFIGAEKADVYFLYDAASLLTTFDRSGASDAAIEDALLRTDLVDIDMAGYIEVALALSHRGKDVGRIASRYLHYPNVDSYLPIHGGYKVDRHAGAILLYGSMPPDTVDDYLSKEVTSSEQYARDAAAITWALNMTERSFAGLAKLGDMKGFSETAREHVRTIMTYRPVAVSSPKYTREQILAKLARFPEIDPDIDAAENKALDNSLYATLQLDDLPAVREARRKLVQGVSNESVEGYDELSRILYNLINKLDAYRSLRVHQ